MSESSDEDSLTPIEWEEQTSRAELKLLPGKSREKYLKAYELFDSWRIANSERTFSETLLLSYFSTLAETKQPSTLWTTYSMLKTTFKTKLDVDISNYHKLLSFLKRQSKGHKAKKTKVLTAENINKFIHDAPDAAFLATKVALIVGISGACRSSELVNITVDSFEKHSDKLVLVNLTNTINKIDRTFLIQKEYVDIIEKYKLLRPPNTEIDRFFLQYRNGKCSRQPIGINKFGAMPRQIATFLKLENPELYAGNCFRKTSATLLACTGYNLTTLKNHRGCNSNTFVEREIEDSSENKAKIRNIEASKNPQTSTSQKSTSRERGERHRLLSPISPINTYIGTDNITHSQGSNTKIKVPKKTTTFNLQNCSNFTFYF